MKKLNPLTKAVHKFIMREPDDNVALLELVSDASLKIKDISRGDYKYSMVGDDVIFDSLSRFDNEPLFSLDFKFLDYIDEKIRNNKTVIDKHNLSPGMVFIKLRRLVKTCYCTDNTELRVYLCDISTLEIKRKIIFNVFKTDDSDIIILEDDLGDEYKITLGGLIC